MTRPDPVETIVSEALTSRGIRFTTERTNAGQRLDFYLPDFDLLIECKQFSSGRTAAQIEGLQNVILIQGLPAARAFAELVRGP